PVACSPCVNAGRTGSANPEKNENGKRNGIAGTSSCLSYARGQGTFALSVGRISQPSGEPARTAGKSVLRQNVTTNFDPVRGAAGVGCSGGGETSGSEQPGSLTTSATPGCTPL